MTKSDPAKWLSGIVVDRHDRDFLYVTRVVLVRRTHNRQFLLGYINEPELLKSEPDGVKIIEMLHKTPDKINTHVTAF